MSFQGTRYVWSLDVPMPLPPPPMPPTPPPPPPPHVAQFCCVTRRTTRKAARERANSDFMPWIIKEPGSLKPAVLPAFRELLPRPYIRRFFLDILTHAPGVASPSGQGL